MATGYDGLLNYRNARKTEIDADCSPAPTSSFHDGGRLLSIVQEHHQGLFSIFQHQDFITQFVVDGMVEDMLGIPEDRPTADQLWIKSQRILSKAEDRFTASEGRTSERGRVAMVCPRSIRRDSVLTHAKPKPGTL